MFEGILLLLLKNLLEFLTAFILLCSFACPEQEQLNRRSVRGFCDCRVNAQWVRWI
jgi:hypothetical protein